MQLGTSLLTALAEGGVCLLGAKGGQAYCPFYRSGVPGSSPVVQPTALGGVMWPSLRCPVGTGAQGSGMKMQTVWPLLFLKVIYCLSSLAWSFRPPTNISAALGG